jgi:hypothetical protein
MSKQPFHHDAMYGISRVPRGSWEVELKREGVVLSKTFSFRFHGGEETALLRAQAWRDEIVKKHPPMTRRARAEIVMSTSRTGIAGVNCKIGPDGQPQGWIARTRIEPGKTLHKIFSVRRYGAQAKQLAIDERQRQLQQMQGHVNVHPSEALVRAAPKQTLPSGLPVPLTLRQIVRRTNRSGIPGVFFRRSHPTAPGIWVAATSIGVGKYLRRSFSVGKYGEEQAKALAIAEREKQLKQLPPRAPKTKSTRTA